MTNRSRDGGRQVRIRSGGAGGTGGIEPGAQVLQVVAINGYPVVTRNGKLFALSSPIVTNMRRYVFLFLC